MNDIYIQEIRSRVCAKCIDTDMHGNCLLHYDEMCAVEEHLPRIVEAVGRVKSDKIDAYITELRNIVCSVCINQSVDGTCSVRDRLDCGLDRYFPLIVEVIEEVEARRIPA